MPFVENKVGREFNTYEAPPQAETSPGLWDTFEAGFRMENPVLNAADYMSKPIFNPDANFQIGPSLRQYDTDNGTSMFEQYRDRFMGVQSQDEMDYEVSKIKQQETDKDTLSRAGWLGVVAGVSGGLVSPTTFIPLIGAGGFAARVAGGAAAGLLGGALDETALYSNQKTRTQGEVAFSLAASTALGGILGGAVGMLSRGERVAAEQELLHVSRPQGVGADVVQAPDPGGLASGAKTGAAINDSTRVFTNPVTQTINQGDYQTWRTLMQQFSDSGLSMERNVEGVPTSPGGTVENNITTYMGRLGMALEDSDAKYADYMFDGNAPRLAPNVRASLAGTFNGAGKLSRSQFDDEVTRAIWNGFDHPIPQVVATAKQISSEVFEPMLKEAQRVGLMPEDIKLVGDKAYASRIYNVTAIQTRTQEFVQKLADNYRTQLEARFNDELSGFKVSQGKRQDLAEDLARPADQVEELGNKFREQLKQIDETLPEDVQNLEASISQKRATARAIRANNEPTLQNEGMIKQLLKDARDEEKAAGDSYAKIKTQRSNLRRRINNLNKSTVALDAKRAAKLDRVGRIEELNLDAMQRVIKKAQTTLKSLDRWSDKKLDAEVSKLKDQFASTSSVFDRGEERIAKMHLEEDPDLHRLGAVEDVQEGRSGRLDDIAQRLETAEGIDREAIRSEIQYGLDKTMLAVEDLNRRRVLRRQRLQEEIAKLDPTVVAERLRTARDAVPQAVGDFARKWEAQGAEGVDPTAGVADFGDIARQSAEVVKDKIVGTYDRLPYSDILAGKNGPELSRVLDIPSQEIDEFLDKNINRVLKSYVKTMAPDTEIYRKFGTLDWREIIQPAVEERQQLLDAVAKAKSKDGTPWSKKKIEKETKRLNDQFDLHRNNVAAVIERLRGQRGLPSNPDGFAYRAAKTIMNLNVLRMMGMVTISSFPDLGRPVMRYGLTRTFRDGFAPLLTNLKAFKMNAREARLAGAAMDTVLHTRAMAIRDVTDDLRHGSKFEKSVEYMTNRMGIVAAFDYWTEGGKLLTSSIANAKMMESLAKVAGNDGNIPIKEATQFLAQNGIDGDTAAKIWNEVTVNGGGGKINGTWWPNTESWKDQDALRIYRQALSREINNTIITPGVERPLLSDANMVGRMLYQFKSFGMSSTPKLLLAGLQQRDAAILSGSLASLGLGALSYYLWAVATGGESYQKMLDAPIEKWADEAINRSGLTAGVSEVQRVAQDIPLLANYASFSGQRQSRRAGDDLVSGLLGPSYDFAKNALGVVAQLQAPTKGTVKQFVRLLPYQNTMGLREAIDAVSNAIGQHLPDRR